MGFDDAHFRREDEQMGVEALDWSSPAMAGITMEELEQRGFARLKVGTPDTYAPHANGNFPTPSGKVELKASMAAGGSFVLPLFRQGSNEFQDGTPVDPLPCYIPPQESRDTNPALAQKYPLNILSPKNHAFLNSGYGNIARQLGHAGEQYVVMHPADARARGVAEGERVEVFNDRGRFHAELQVSDEVRQGVILAPLGYWASNSANGRSVNVVNSSRYADMGRGPTFSDTLVEVRAL
jgi:anaerobic selenocysteine-containing dehydrogenase